MCIFEVCTDERRHGPVRVQVHEGRGWTGLGCGNEQHYTTRPSSGASHPRRQALSTFLLTSKKCLPPGRGLTASLASGRKSRSSGTPWSTLSTSCAVVPRCKFSLHLCRRWWNSCWTSCAFFDTLLPVCEQVIEVPKILLDDVLVRIAVHDTQLAEQLVEVPTIVSFSSLQRIMMEQNVDIPVPGDGGRLAGLQGFLRGQSSTGVEQIVVIPGGGLQGFRPGQSSFASSLSPTGVHENADEPGEGVCRTFPRLKKSGKVTRHSSARVLRSASSSELSAHQMALAARPQDVTDEGNIFREDAEKFWIRLDTGQWKLLRTDTVVDQPWP